MLVRISLVFVRVFFSAWLASFFFIFSCFGSLGRARCLLSSAEPPLVRSAAFWVNLLALLARIMIELFVYSPKSCFNVRSGISIWKMCINDQKSNFRLLRYTMISVRALPPPHCTRKNKITQNLHSWTQRVKITFLLILISLDCWFFIWWDTFFGPRLYVSEQLPTRVWLDCPWKSQVPRQIMKIVWTRDLNMAHNFLLWYYLSFTLTRMQETWDATNWNNMLCGGWPPWLLYQVFHIKLKTK